MKEPLIVDFLEQFLAEHNLSNYPRVPSRPGSIRSFRSGRSLTPMSGRHSPKPPGSPSSLTAAAAHVNSNRLSVRLSQAELLEYSHRLNSGPTTPTSSSHSLKSQSMGLPPSPVRSTSPVVSMIMIVAIDIYMTHYNILCYFIRIMMNLKRIDMN